MSGVLWPCMYMFIIIHVCVCAFVCERKSNVCLSACHNNYVHVCFRLSRGWDKNFPYIFINTYALISGTLGLSGGLLINAITHPWGGKDLQTNQLCSFRNYERSERQTKINPYSLKNCNLTKKRKQISDHYWTNATAGWLSIIQYFASDDRLILPSNRPSKFYNVFIISPNITERVSHYTLITRVEGSSTPASWII